MTGTTLTDRALVRVSGDGARDFLGGLVTNAVPAAGEGPRYAGLLTPQGKALFDFVMWADGDDILIDVEATRAEPLVRRLSMYRLRRPIAIAVADGLAVHWSPDGEDGSADPRLPSLGQRWLAPPGEPALGWTEHRLSQGVVEGMAEFGDGTTLWLETNAREMNGVSFTKGCYVGQENTARMHHRQKVNRRLLVVPLAEAGEAARIAYPAVGLAVIHSRVEGLDPARLPDWLRSDEPGAP